MRFRHPDGSTVHLAYCTNVHPAETLDGVLAQLRDHCEPVRRRLGRDRLGIGLWLARDAARALVTDPSALPPERVLLDHLNETTVEEAKDSGCWLGFSVYPDTKMDEERMVAILRAYGPERVLVNSAADWGRSDPLKTRKVGDLMLAEGFDEDDVDLVLWRNPVAFYGLSGRLDLDVAATPATHEGNSVLRGAPRDDGHEPAGVPAAGV